MSTKEENESQSFAQRVFEDAWEELGETGRGRLKNLFWDAYLSGRQPTDHEIDQILREELGFPTQPPSQPS